MSKILLILKREYITRVKKKSFIITTLLVPLSFVLLMVMQIAIIAFSSDTMRIVIKDETGKFAHRIKDTKSLYFKKSSKSLEELRNSYITERFDGILYIPKLDMDNPNGIKYISDNLLGGSTKSYIQREIKDELRKMKLTKLGVDNKTFQQIQKVDISISEEGSKGNSIGSTGIATGIGMFMGFIMYMVIFIYGSLVMRSVMEEKTNRIVEVILSSVRPFKLMMGKILGIGAVGITQFTIWIVLLFGINIFISLVAGGAIDVSSSPMASSQADVEEVMGFVEEIQDNINSLPIALLVFSFMFYFVGGYVLYAALFAGLGAAVNDESDAQTLTLPVSVPVIIAIFILMAIVENPNGNMAVWSSIFPLFSPIIMPARIAFGVPMWEVAVSMICLVIGCIVAVWIAAKIYRMGILLYGKKISFKEIGKWMVRS